MRDTKDILNEVKDRESGIRKVRKKKRIAAYSIMSLATWMITVMTAVGYGAHLSNVQAGNVSSGIFSSSLFSGSRQGVYIFTAVLAAVAVFFTVKLFLEIFKKRKHMDA